MAGHPHCRPNNTHGPTHNLEVSGHLGGPSQARSPLRQGWDSWSPLPSLFPQNMHVGWFQQNEACVRACCTQQVPFLAHCQARGVSSH